MVRTCAPEQTPFTLLRNSTAGAPVERSGRHAAATLCRIVVGIGIMRRMQLNRFVVAIAILVAVPLFARSVRVDMKDGSGRYVGSATVKSAGKGVEIKLNLYGMPAGEHAIHIHQNATCVPPDFKSAGPHFNPEGKKHGLDNAEGPHAGDMQNFIVDHTGKAKVTVRDPNVTLGRGENSIFANGGTALVIHAKADDMKTDPSGNSGDRIACGVITK